MKWDGDGKWGGEGLGWEWDGMGVKLGWGWDGDEIKWGGGGQCDPMGGRVTLWGTV